MKFKTRTDVEPGERLVEGKNLNRHCAIFGTTFQGGSLTIPEFGDQVRQRVCELTKPNFLRGLAFGVIIETDSVFEGMDQLPDLIDGRQRKRSVWQWLIVKINDPKVCIGIHTWMQVFLSPSFDQILWEAESDGFAVRSFKKGKDKLMDFLTAFSGGRYPEYEADGETPKR